MDSVQHPYGFLCFFYNFDFRDAIEFCTENNIDCTDFSFHGCEYIAVFSVHDFFALVQFCENEALDFVKFVYL